MKIKALLCSLLLIAGFANAEQQLPEALQDAEPQQLMGVGFGLMQLSEPEKQAFGKIIRTFGQDVRSAIASEARKNAPNRQRRIRRRVEFLFEDLDERLSDIVTEERRQGYLIFKKGLAQQMRPQ